MANAGIGNGVSGNGGGGSGGSTSSSSSGGGGGANGRYANCDENSSAEGAPSTSSASPPKAQYENIYEAVNNDPTVASASNQQHAHVLHNQNDYQPVQIPHINVHPHNEQPAATGVAAADEENIYESIEDLRRRSIIQEPVAVPGPSNIAPADLPGCSSVTYGRIGNAYGRIDVIGHGIGRIERHLSSSCGSGIDNHYGTTASSSETMDPTGRISKVSVQWLLVNKWLPLWIANTDSGGRDYRIIDFLLGHRGDYEAMPPQGVQARECNGFYHPQFVYAAQQAQQQQQQQQQQQGLQPPLLNQPPSGSVLNCPHANNSNMSPPDYVDQPIYQPVYGQNLLNARQPHLNPLVNAVHVHAAEREQNDEENVHDE